MPKIVSKPTPPANMLSVDKKEMETFENDEI